MGLFVDIEKKLRSFTLQVAFDTGGGMAQPVAGKEGYPSDGHTPAGPGEPSALGEVGKPGATAAQTYGILGASGCGKSMTLKCIAGIEKPDRGRIVLDGRVLFDSEKHINLRPQQRRVGYLFQNYALFPHMTVLQNLEIAAGARRERHHSAGPMGITNHLQKGIDKEDRHGMAGSPGGSENRPKTDSIREYLRLLRIEDLVGAYPRQLSGGQQQRVALARILVSDPNVLLLDEPFAALDYHLKEQLQMEIFDTLKAYRGEIFLVTHNRDEIYRLCQRMYVIDQGRLVVSGETKSVFREPGTVSAAKITGCKNIARIHRCGERAFSIPEWGVICETGMPIPEDVTHAGIRAHDVEAVFTASESKRDAAQADEVQRKGNPWEDQQGYPGGNLGGDPVDPARGGPGGSQRGDSGDSPWGGPGVDLQVYPVNRIIVRDLKPQEDPFEMIVIVNGVLWWKMAKEVWYEKYAGKRIPMVRIPTEHLFLLRGEDGDG
ncbi:MAG: ATP-binding cassette domain-containing protein [Lachnospiraceae bacterium]|jgi:molybdate transport system ATP-binding protein|nr:ATP-binding cassette domain-containing protein [Lachnospiraceae bacterium]